MIEVDKGKMQDLCSAALEFSFNVLSTGGHFVCKFYQGPEEKKFENQLKALFHKVHREKPDSSRSVRIGCVLHWSRSDLTD